LYPADLDLSQSAFWLSHWGPNETSGATLPLWDFQDIADGAPTGVDETPEDPSLWPTSTLPAPFIEGCELIIGSAGIPSWMQAVIQTHQRGKALVYANNTITILEPTSTPGTPAIQVSQLGTLPSGWTVV
jgi:hypothetical protein